MSKKRRKLEQAKKDKVRQQKNAAKQARYNKSNWEEKKEQKRQSWEDVRNEQYPGVPSQCPLSPGQFVANGGKCPKDSCSLNCRYANASSYYSNRPWWW